MQIYAVRDLYQESLLDYLIIFLKANGKKTKVFFYSLIIFPWYFYLLEKQTGLEPKHCGP